MPCRMLPGPQRVAAPSALKERNFPRLFSDVEVAARFGVSVRVIHDRARAKGLGRKFGRVRWFTEAEVLALYGRFDMLKLIERQESPHWYARGTHLGGNIVESLGTSDRAQAEALIAKLQNEIFERAHAWSRSRSRNLRVRRVEVHGSRRRTPLRRAVAASFWRDADRPD